MTSQRRTLRPRNRLPEAGGTVGEWIQMTNLIRSSRTSAGTRSCRNCFIPSMKHRSKHPALTHARVKLFGGMSLPLVSAKGCGLGRVSTPIASGNIGYSPIFCNPPYSKCVVSCNSSTFSFQRGNRPSPPSSCKIAFTSSRTRGKKVRSS